MNINLFFERHPFVLINNDFASNSRKLKFFVKHCVKVISPTTKIEYKLSNVFFSSKLQYEFKP